MSDEVTLTRQVVAAHAVDRRPYLDVLSGSLPCRTALDRDTIVVGRSRSADLRLDVDGVSRQHARLVRSGLCAVSLVDLGAKNGTFVNGEKVGIAALHHGDRIQIGPVVLEFSLLRTGASELESSLLRTGASELESSLLRTGASELESSLLRTGASELESSLLKAGASELESSPLRAGASELESSPLRRGASELESSRLRTGASELESSLLQSGAAPVVAVASPEQPSIRSSLSDREWEVALHVAQGRTNGEIAKVLGISRRTVATHLERMFERLQIHSRAVLASLVTRGAPRSSG